jgi:RES domain-containing protein
MKVRSNPVHEFFQQRLAGQSPPYGAWVGTAYRVTSLDYPDPKSILQGEGSFRFGGRWNAVGSFRAVYGSTTDTVALDESRANADYAGIRMAVRTARLVVAIDFSLSKVLDLTLPEMRRMLGVTLETLRQEDWRKVQDQGFESLTQALGRAAVGAGAEGMLVPSARIRNGVNVVYFPQNRQPGSKAEVCESSKLAGLPTKAVQSKL